MATISSEKARVKIVVKYFDKTSGRWIIVEPVNDKADEFQDMFEVGDAGNKLLIAAYVVGDNQ